MDQDRTAVFNRKERSPRTIIHFGKDNQVDLVLFQTTAAVTPHVDSAVTNLLLIIGCVKC
ncbi:hypothetical protein [Streptantibioticus ferralitis]|uniref:Uncharacterized protein n=1 Tax=Streptantibioticus ferralitis TaxID=236510 RepID=A0ABT5ZCQ4_9ACTN|nr:hypothetical protein [Streptantibioticus ferralitis]MDF2261625.1 hypothetical protein [Streptantibioticus ferralitis]